MTLTHAKDLKSATVSAKLIVGVVEESVRNGGEIITNGRTQPLNGCL
jgi:hypothetical protein